MIDFHWATVVDCVEYEHVKVDADLWLTDEHRIRFNSDVEGRDILRAGFKNGVLTLQATSYVGVIPLNDNVVLRVKPRVPLASLTRMVADTGHSLMPLSVFRGYSGRGNADDWAMDIYTKELLKQLDELLDAGLWRSYVRRAAEGHFPTGRIDFARSVQRFVARGIDNKVAYSWHERTVDTPANRCIKAALEHVHDYLARERPQPRRGTRQQLSRLAGHLHAFADVSTDPDLQFMEDPEVLGLIPLPDHRSYYGPTLDLCLIILREVGIALELGGSDVELSSLLIDTNQLFERFVRVSLARLAREQGWPVEVLDGNTDGNVDLYDVPAHLPSPLGHPMTALASVDAGKVQPDVVIRALDGTFPLVAEVKNTVHGKDAKADDVLPDRGEIEQAVTYALRYGLDFALLIHPWIKGTKGLVYVGRVQSIDVYDYRLDLSTVDGTDAALADLASSIAALARIAPDQVPTSA